MICRYCGSENVEYHGHDDGGGDYGDAIVELWYCYDCESDFEANAWRDEDAGHGVSTRDILFAPVRERMRRVAQHVQHWRVGRDAGPEDLPF